MPFAQHRAHQLGQARLDLVMAIARDERDPPRLARGVEHVQQPQQRVGLQARPALHADGIADAAQIFDMGRPFEPGAVADPQHVRRRVIPFAGNRILPRQRLLERQQQRLVAGVEAGPAQLRHAVRIQAAGAHEVQRLADLVGHRLELGGPGGPAHEIEHPAMHSLQRRIAAGRKGAQQVQRRGRLVIGADHPRRVGLAGFGREGDVVDIVAAIAGQLHAADRFGIGRSGLGELPRHAADLHHRQLGRKGQHHRHLQQHAERVADIVGMELGKAFGAIAALQQERLAGRHLGEIGLQVARLARKDERRKLAKLRLDRGERRLVPIDGHLNALLAAPAFRRPLRRHVESPSHE